MKIFFVIAMLALAGIGFVYFQGYEQDRESARELARSRAQTKQWHDASRKQALESAEETYRLGVKFAQEARQRDLSAGKNSLLVEQLYETKLINLRAERDEKIKKANEQNPP